MDNGHFYFINDQYFIDFPDPYLMQNKEVINGQEHPRPKRNSPNHGSQRKID